MNEMPIASPRGATQAGTLWRVLGTAHELESRVEAALEEVSLSLAKLGVLRSLLAAGGGLTLGELAEQSQCVRSNITQLVDRLEAEGLVRRVGDTSDRRVRRALLTPAGKESCEQGARILEAMESQVAALLGPADDAALKRALKRLST